MSKMRFLKSKPKVLVCVLTGSERGGWVNPPLVQNLMCMLQDKRFTVEIVMMMDRRPVDYARNCCVAMARDKGFDWLLMIDSDQSFWGRGPLDILSRAKSEKDVIGFPTCTGMGTVNVCTTDPRECDGEFFTVARVVTSALFVSHRVWEKIPGPWFKWCYDETSELRALEDQDGVGLPEDYWFCDLVRRNGFRVWIHQELIPHWKTNDITDLGTQIRDLRRQNGLPCDAHDSPAPCDYPAKARKP